METATQVLFVVGLMPRSTSEGVRSVGKLCSSGETWPISNDGCCKSKVSSEIWVACLISAMPA